MPDYPEVRIDEIRHQADFHANFWADIDAELVIAEAQSMGQVVKFYSGFLSKFPDMTPVLDLGGGRGLLTKALLEHGYNAFGCDPSTHLVTCAHDLLQIPLDRYFQNDIFEFVKTKTADIGQAVGAVYLWHVIEHLENPLSVLRSLKSLLRADGIIIAQGPLLDPRYIFPEHNFLHSESNIGWIARELDMKLVFLDSFSSDRFISFVFANRDSDEREIDPIYTPEIPDAAGALFNTLTLALRGVIAESGVING